MLADTGVAGQPESHFHEPSIAAWKAYYDLSAEDFADEKAALSAIFNAAHDYGMGAGDIFALRLQRHSFEFFMRQLRVLHPESADQAGRFQAAFGETLFIHLTRNDKLGQAISYVKATQTGLWHRRADGSELERLSPPQDPTYDGHAIEAQLATFIADDSAWNDWFAAEQISPLRLTYEGLSADPTGIVTEILDALGLDRKAAEGLSPSVAKLSDETSLDWETRFVAEGRNVQPAK